MNTELNVTVLGVRGSRQLSKTEYLTYGGNTSCFAVEYAVENGRGLLFLDAGSGIADFDTSGYKEAHIWLSHLHLDHIAGLVGCRFLADPEAVVHLYGQAEFLENLQKLVAPPYWPLTISDFPAKVLLHPVCAGESVYLQSDRQTETQKADKAKLAETKTTGKMEEERANANLETVQIDTLAGNHPGGSLLCRVTAGEKSLVYALDCEMDNAVMEALAEFSKETDLLIWDAEFAPGQIKKGWGHSSWEEGLMVCRRVGAKKILMTHFSAEYTDAFLKEQEEAAAAQDTRCLFAREGMVLAL